MAHSSVSLDTPDPSAPVGNESSDKHEHLPPNQPVHATTSARHSAQATNTSDSPGMGTKAPSTEEPELALEPDLPTDGRDETGEQMIRDLPVRPELSDNSNHPT